MVAHYKTHYFTVDLLFMLTIIFMKFNYYELNTSVNKGFHPSANSTNLLRFRDFEPRSFAKTDTDVMALPTRQTAIMPLNRRRSRGFQFHADDKDLSIELEFIVPFVRIPIGRSMEMTKAAFRNLFNLNLHSILTTGAVVAVGGLFALILKVLFTPFAGLGGDYKKTSRNSKEYSAFNNLDNSTKYYSSKEPTASYNVISYMESKLHQSNIDLSKCIQKSICTYLHKGRAENNYGTAESVKKIVDGILSLHSVHNILNGTAVQHAIDTAKSDEDCSEIYSDCNWRPSAPKLIRMLTKVMKYLNIT